MIPLQRDLSHLSRNLLSRRFSLESVWNVWVWTSDVRGAGTDANVFMTLYGDKGKTDEVPIGNATDNFEQGQLDKFKVICLICWLLPRSLRIFKDLGKDFGDPGKEF